jgi:diguanylate cyclase
MKPRSIPSQAVVRSPFPDTLLRTVLWVTLTATAAAWVAMSVTGRWFTSFMMGLLFLGVVCALLLSRHGQPERAGRVLVMTLGICAAVLMAVGKGPIDEAALTLPGLMIFSSLFTSRRTFQYLLGLIALLLLGLAVVHIQEWHVFPNLPVTGITFVTVSIVLSATSFFVWLMASALHASLANLEVENQRVRDSLTKIEVLAHHDALTGLPNRALARERFDWMLKQSARNNTGAALLYLDLDNFKHVNDSIGHAAGDALLTEVARRLSECVRAEDTVSRQGGDEFLLVLGNISDESAVRFIALKILERMAAPFELEGVELTTTCSLGVAVFPANGSDFDTLLKHADMAMYKAKESGRNAVRHFDESLNTKVLEDLRLHTALRQAMGNGELELHFQPQFRLADEQLVGAEALLRWRHPEHGYVPPGRFVPLAERSGLIVEIGHWVMNEACRQAAAWAQNGLGALVVSVNVSPVQLRRDGFLQSVQAALASHSLPASQLCLEVTESLLMADSSPQRELLANLQSLGLGVSIDDFGTGYSSLSYLRQFAVGQLKIDQSFVRSMDKDAAEHGIVLAIVQIAESLGLESVAEGIEDANALAKLRHMGCELGQGYFWSPALPAEEFQKFSLRWAAHTQNLDSRPSASASTSEGQSRM